MHGEFLRGTGTAGDEERWRCCENHICAAL
jgi:hypothetical protein